MGPRCVRAANALVILCAHARLSCQWLHISWDACISNSSGEFVPEVEDFI